MVRVIMDDTGSGKTKQMIEMINNAVQTEHGNVVCIEKGNKLTFDIHYQIRLVEASQYNVDSYTALKGFISKESPVGRAVIGARVGDRVHVDMGGGKGYMFGTILGVIFLSSLSTGFNLMNVNAYYQQIIKGVVLLVAIAFNARSGNTFKRKEKAK